MSRFVQIAVTVLVILGQVLPTFADAASAAPAPPPTPLPVVREAPPQYDWSRASLETWEGYFERIARRDGQRLQAALVATVQEILGGSADAYQNDEELYERVEYYVLGKFIEPLPDEHSLLGPAVLLAELARRQAPAPSGPRAYSAPAPELLAAYNNWLSYDFSPSSPQDPAAGHGGASKAVHKLKRYNVPPETWLLVESVRLPADESASQATLAPAGSTSFLNDAMAGVITVTADTISGTQASGHVVLGDYFPLSGNATWNSTALTGTGCLTMSAAGEQVALFTTSSFTVSTATGVIVPSDNDISAFQLDQLAGFDTFSLTISAVDLVQGLVTGTAGITLTTPGIHALGASGGQVTSTVSFVMQATPAGGIGYAGSVDELTLTLGGMKLQASHVGLSDDGVKTDVVTLTVPALFGGNSVVVNDLLISPSGVSLGSAGMAFDLPDLAYGDGSKLKLTGNRARLGYNSGEYEFAITSTLAISLPANVQDITATVKLAYVEGQAQLSGALSGLSLTVAGATLAMKDIAFSNDGVSVVSATLTLPASLGSASASISATSVTSAGLSFAEAVINFPDIKFGDGSKLKLTGNRAVLTMPEGGYEFAITSTLAISLPANVQNITATVKLAYIEEQAQLSGALSGLSLTVAGATLAMKDIAFSNEGVSVVSATLTLPASLGNASASISATSVTSAGLSFAEAVINFPDIKFGDGSKLKLTGNRARLTMPEGGYEFAITSTLAISLPANVQNITTTVKLAYVGGQAQLSGALSGMSLTVAGATLAMKELAFSNEGVSVVSATLTLPASLGSASASISGISITNAGLVFAQAQIALPDINIGSGKLVVSGITATVSSETAGYAFSAHGRLSVTLPGTSAQADLTFAIDPQGNASGQAASLSLTVAGANLAMRNLAFDNSGVSVYSATLTLPASLGSASASIQGISITQAGLVFAQAEIGFPDIKFGDGSKVKVTGARALLKTKNARYGFDAQGTLLINLPGNPPQTVSLAFSMEPDGNLKATIVKLDLTLAGCKLSIDNMSLSNAGLAGEKVSLTLPASLGGASGAVSGLKITKDGISFDQVSILLPDIKFGDGSKVKLQRLTATLTMSGGVYKLDLSGTLSLRLPDNSQDIPITASLDSNGNLSASISGSITLKIATASLTLSGVTLNNAGLTVASASLKLPNLLGGVEGALTDVKITKDGLSVGGGAATVSFPDFSLGGASTNLKVSGARLKIEFSSNGSASSYKLTLSGTLSISVAGQSASASGTVSIDNAGHLSGSVASFSLSIAGLTLEAKNIRFSSDASLSIELATLKLPAAFGGGGATLQNVTISKDGALSIGGGSFELPTISVGGFKLQLSGSLLKVGNDYQISAHGTIAIPGFGAAVGCSGIQVGVVLYATQTGQTVLQILPAEATYAAYTVPAPYGPAAPGGYSLKLKEATLGMVNCKIPVASTGVYITALSGHVTLDGNSTQVNVKLSLTAGPTLFGMSVLSGDLDTTLTTDPFSLVMLGTIKLFSIQVGGADAKITSNSFSANLWIDMKYLQGKLAVNAWSDTRGFHLTGSAQLTLAIDKGSIASYCVPVPHCSTSWVHGRTCWGRRWWRTCVNWSYPVVSCWLEDTCVTIPPWNIHYSVGVDVGEFSNGAWGFKGYVTILGANYGFYIDSRNNIVFGNVESYRLVTPATVLKAQRAAKLRAAGAELPDSLREFDYIRLNAAGEIVIDVPITQTREAIFSLARLGDAPTLSLVAPDGTPISPANLPAGVEYHEFVTYTVKHGQAASSTFSLLPAAETRTLAGDGLRLSLCASQAPASGQPSLAGSLPVPERIARHMGDDWGGVAVQLPASAAEAAAGATSAQLRFLHAWPDAGALDVWVDDDPYASNLGRYGLSRYIALAEGRHAIQVTPAGITSTLLVSTSVDLAQYTDYTFVLLGAERGHWLLVDENMPLPQGHALLRLVHLAPGTPAVDLTDPYGSYYAGDVPFKTASRYVELVGGRHDVQVRLADQAAILLDTSALTLTQGSIYSVFLVGTAGITPGLQLVSSLDAAPPSQVRFVNAVAGGPDVDVLHAWPGVTPQASLAWSSVPYSQVTAYAADPGELAQFIVTPAGVSTTHLISLTLDLEGGQDYTMVAAGQPGNIVPLWLKDDNRLPALGQARLRLVALSPDAPAVDLAVRNGPALVENVAYQAASRYAQLAGGVYDLEIRQAGSSTELASLPGLALKEGQVYSLFLVGLPGGYNAVLNTDLATDKNSQVLYQVRQAQVGTWQAVLGGDVKPDGTYVFKALGMVPAPQLSDVSVSLRDATEAEVAWRLTSPQADTKISIFANPGPITTTSIVTGSDGLTATIEIPYFAGQRLAHGLSGSDASWVNGSPQSYTLDLLGSLPSGTYHVWIEALEEHNPPTRVYIPTPIQVVLPWADNWQAGLAAVASYRTLNVSWQDNPSADVDEYILYASDQSTQTMQHELGDAHHFSLTGLDPAQAYTLWIDAVDTRTGRVSHSEQITACPRSAPFSLSVEPPGLEFSNGQSRTFTVTLRTPLATYPNVVRLYGVDEEELRLDAVDLHTAFAQDTVTPTRAGVVVTGTVFAPKTAAEGSWSEVIMAAGGGDLRYAYLPVTVTNPYIDLRVTPDRIVLGEGESVSLSVDIRHFQNHTEPVELSVDGLQDLSYALSQDVVWPGQSARLLITDTQRQSATGDGDRDDRPFIQLWASSSLAASSHTIYYDIVKPDFRVERPQTRPVERVNILAGESVTLPFEARSLNGWAQPVSAVYLQHTTLPSTTVHLHSGDGVPLDMHVPITPPLSMYLQVDSTPDTPLSTRGYELELCGVNVRSGCARYELGVYAPGAIFTDLYAHLHQRAQAGDLITYTWHVGNAGPLAASNLVVTITLPPGTTLSSVQQGECVLAGEQVVCSLGDAPRQGQFVVEMTLQVDPGLNAKEVSLDGNCTITADQQDLDRGDTELCVDPLPQQDYDLEVSMSAGPGPVWAGQELVYTITVRNAGPGPVPRVNVYNALPWATTVVALDDRCFTYVTDVSCNLGPLEPGETATLQSTLQLPLHVGGVLVNIARASSFVDPLDRIKGFDVDLHNNYAALYTPIQEGEAPQPPAHPVYLPIVLRGM